LHRSPRRLRVGVTQASPPEHAQQDLLKKWRYAPGDWVLARRPAGSLLITARDVPDAWRLFRGVTEATAYSATRLRFSPACRAKRSVGSDEVEGLSSVRSRAARIRDFEEPGSAIVGVARKERPRSQLERSVTLTRLWRGFPTLTPFRSTFKRKLVS
jgi:hypothetical protein